MSNEQKGLGNKLKRLFVEPAPGEESSAPAESPGGASSADVVAEIARGMNASVKASAPAASVPAASAAPAQSVGMPTIGNVEPAKVDFDSIYRAAGMTEADLEQAGRAEKLLRTLPTNLPVETQRQILESALKTFGVDPAKIRQTMLRQQRALATYANISREDATRRDSEGKARIEALRAEISKLEKAAEDRARAQAGVELACKHQSESTGHMIDFLPSPPAAPEKP